MNFVPYDLYTVNLTEREEERDEGGRGVEKETGHVFERGRLTECGNGREKERKRKMNEKYRK